MAVFDVRTGVPLSNQTNGWGDAQLVVVRKTRGIILEKKRDYLGACWGQKVC